VSLPDWLTARPVAHRGLHRPGPSRPENSLAALAAAQRGGYAAEIDVQLSADRQVMLFHDRDLHRLTGRRGRLADRPAAALSRLRLTGGRERIPLLSEALAAFPRLPLLIELKMGDTGLAPAAAALLERHPGPFAIQSFDPALVAWFAENRPDWPRGLICYTRLALSFKWQEPRYDPVFIERCRPDFIAWHVGDLPPPAVAVRNRPCLTWTVRRLAQRRIARACADNMIFEGRIA
jgi:glycerophosphoryl diester phosphodiesterase